MNSEYVVRTILIVFITSCGETAEDRGSLLFAADSAGIRIVRVPDLNTLDLPEWQTRLVYSTTGGASAVELFEVGDAVFLADSSLVIADRRSPELIFLDRKGSVRGRIGRQGEGPGEYTHIDRVGVGPDGNLFVFDGTQQRVTLLDAEKNVADILRVDLQGRFLPYMPLSRLPSGGFTAVLEMREILPPGLQRDPLLLVLTDSASQVTDTLDRWSGKERNVTEGGNRWTAVGFARTALYAGRGAYTVVGTTDSLDLTLYTGPKPVLRLRGEYVPVLVTADERDAWTEHFLAVLPEPVRPRWRRWLEQSTVRESYPAFGALAVDPSGRIWVGDYAKLGQQQRRWTVFGPDGQPIGRLDLPVYGPRWIETEIAIAYSPTHELLDVTSDRIAILKKDEFDVQYVEVLEIVGPR